ncbi:MAG TPA: CGNR zinc finger domain-containing protein [Pseudomonadales bacterium]
MIDTQRDTPATARNPLEALRETLAVNPPSVAALSRRHVAAFEQLAGRLRRVFEAASAGNVDAAATVLNELLAQYPAHPHLAKEGGVWRLHHHPADAGLIPMWTAICAEALARRVGAGHAARFGVCAADRCDRVFFDSSRNGSRRFCSTACQNRTKTAAFRRRVREG